MNRSTTRNASLSWLVLKSVLAVVLALGILFVILFSGFLLLAWADDQSGNYYENRCEEYYQSRNFADLCGYMDEYSLFGDEYEKYSEVVEGAILKSEYLQWSAAAEQGMDGAAQKAEEILTQLRILSEQAKYPENREIFSGFLLELQNT